MNAAPPAAEADVANSRPSGLPSNALSGNVGSAMQQLVQFNPNVGGNMGVPGTTLFSSPIMGNLAPNFTPSSVANNNNGDNFGSSSANSNMPAPPSLDGIISVGQTSGGGGAGFRPVLTVQAATEEPAASTDGMATSEVVGDPDVSKQETTTTGSNDNDNNDNPINPAGKGDSTSMSNSFQGQVGDTPPASLAGMMMTAAPAIPIDPTQVLFGAAPVAVVGSIPDISGDLAAALVIPVFP